MNRPKLPKRAILPEHQHRRFTFVDGLWLLIFPPVLILIIKLVLFFKLGHWVWSLWSL